MRRWTRCLVGLGIALLCLEAGAQNRDQPGGSAALLPEQGCEGQPQPMDVTSERMTFDSQTNTFIFEGKVHVERCNMIMLSDRLQVTNDPKGERVERIVATGNVRFQQEERHARADRAEYFDTEQKLVLTGNPRAWNTQDQNELTGEEIVVFLEQKKVYVKDARVVFHPHQPSSKGP